MEKAIQISYDDLFEESCRYASEAGFRSIAVGYTKVVGKSDSEWEKITEDIQNTLDKYKLRCVQSHPHYYYPLLSSEQLDDVMERDMRCAIKSSAAIGAEFCVFHPIIAISSGYCMKKSLEDNKAWFSGLLECALSCGTGVAAENLPLFTAPGSAKPPAASNYELLAPLVDFFNDEHMAVCWDFGHANQTVKKEHAELITALGNRIKCTHVHNNYGNVDYHLPPIYGNTEWEKVLPALGATGYNGPLTLELEFPCKDECGAMLASFIRHSYDCLDYIVRTDIG